METTSKRKIFLSYRRTHANELKPLALNLQQSFDVYFVDDRYQKGMDTDQATNASNLEQSDVVLLLLSKAPSGPPGHWTENLSSMEMFKRCDDLSGNKSSNLSDYCLDEIRRAIELNKIIVPIYSAHLSEEEIQTELLVIKDVTGLHELSATNVKEDAFRLTSSSTRLETYILNKIKKKVAKQNDNVQDGSNGRVRKNKNKNHRRKSSTRTLKKSSTAIGLSRAGSSGNVLAQMSKTKKRRQSFAISSLEMHSLGILEVDDGDSSSNDDDDEDHDEDYDDRKQLESWLIQNEMNSLKKILIEDHGCTTLEDIEDISIEEWKELGLKPAKRKKLLRKISSSNTSNDKSNNSNSNVDVDTVTVATTADIDFNMEDENENEIINVVDESKTSVAEVSQNNLRTISSGGYENSPGKWDVFISYTQHSKSAQLLALELYTEAQSRKLTCWLDSRMDKKSEAAMHEGVMNCRLFIAIVTGPCRDEEHPTCTNEENSYFQRPYCNKECRWALSNPSCIIQPVVQDKSKINSLMNGAPADLKVLQSKEFVALDLTDNEYRKVGMDKVFGVLTNTVGCCVLQ